MRGIGVHDKNVWRVVAFRPQFGALRHSEAVLLVDDRESEPLELHVFFDDGMCSHQQMDAAIYESLHDRLSPLSFHDTGQQFRPHRHVAQQFADGLQVLFGKNLSWRHDTRLIAVVERDEHGHERHERLSRPHVALQQAVHLLSASHVLPYFPNHTLLCSGEREGQVFMVERVEVLTDVAEHISAVLPSVVVGVSENVQLHSSSNFSRRRAC